MSWLSLANGTRVPVRDGFVLGRVAGCDLVVDDTKASRRHARIIVENDVVEIEDLGSSNGTLLNDKPVTRRLLRDGDRVQIGKTVIVFHEGELPAPAASGAAPAAARPAAPAAAALDEEDDLFGGGAPARTEARRAPEPPRAEPPRAVPPPSQPVRAAAPSPAAAPRPPVPPPPAAAPPSPPPPAPPRPAVVEFADEIVEVRKPVQPSQKPAAPTADPTAVTATSGRILQYSKQAAGGGGLLGDDMAQMSGSMRALLYLAALAFAAGVVWLVVRLVG